MVHELQQLLSLHAPSAQVLAASFKTPRQALECLLAGCQAITLPVDVAEQFLNAPAVQAAVEKFEQDWQGRSAAICWGDSCLPRLRSSSRSTINFKGWRIGRHPPTVSQRFSCQPPPV